MTDTEFHIVAAFTAVMLLLALGGVLVYCENPGTFTRLSNILFGSALACALAACAVAFTAVAW